MNQGEAPQELGPDTKRDEIETSIEILEEQIADLEKKLASAKRGLEMQKEDLQKLDEAEKPGGGKEELVA